MNRGKVLIFAPFEIWFFPPRFYDLSLDLEAHYTIKTPGNQVIFGRFSLQLAPDSPVFALIPVDYCQTA